MHFGGTGLPIWRLAAHDIMDRKHGSPSYNGIWTIPMNFTTGSVCFELHCGGDTDYARANSNLND